MTSASASPGNQDMSSTTDRAYARAVKQKQKSYYYNEIVLRFVKKGYCHATTMKDEDCPFKGSYDGLFCGHHYKRWIQYYLIGQIPPKKDSNEETFLKGQETTQQVKNKMEKEAFEREQDRQRVNQEREHRPYVFNPVRAERVARQLGHQIIEVSDDEDVNQLPVNLEDQLGALNIRDDGAGVAPPIVAQPVVVIRPKQAGRPRRHSQ